MSALLDFLSGRAPNLQTQKALIVLGLQNDFLSPDGKLPVQDTDFLDRIGRLIPAFREFGPIVWVRSEFEANRPVNNVEYPRDTVILGRYGESPALLSSSSSPSSAAGSVSPKNSKTAPGTSSKYKKAESIKTKQAATFSACYNSPQEHDDDEELFLTRTARKEPCCIRGSRGAEFTGSVKALIDPEKDLQITKTHYSAFGTASTLLTLRSKLITELFVCGNMTNLSVYATALDASRYGIRITLVEDCLGYRKEDRHDLAIQRLRHITSARVISSEATIEALRNPLEFGDTESDEDESSETSGQEEDEFPTVHEPGDDGMRSGPLEVDSDDSDGEVDFSLIYHRGRFPPRFRADHRIPTPPPQNDRSATYSRQHETGTVRASGSFDAPTGPARLEAMLREVSDLSDDSQDVPLRLKKADLPATSVAGHPSQNSTTDHMSAMRQAQSRLEGAHVSAASKGRPLLGDEKREESAGSYLLYDLLPVEMSKIIFDQLNNEIHWQKMYHHTGAVPRLVCCQAAVGADGSAPVYRHPCDEIIPAHSWTAMVGRVRQAAEKIVGHPLNHALIQLYRSGNDYISEHSDKTLDILPGSSIVNVSFGAQRTMRIRTKRAASARGAERTTHRVPLPHNSALAMSLQTNAEYLHSINWDRRPACELSEAEKAFEGKRISLTFRHIGTFVSSDACWIWGHGATGKTKAAASRVVYGDANLNEELARAFGAENAASAIRWDEIYGKGFDVLHLK